MMHHQANTEQCGWNDDRKEDSLNFAKDDIDKSEDYWKDVLWTL